MCKKKFYNNKHTTTSSGILSDEDFSYLFLNLIVKSFCPKVDLPHNQNALTKKFKEFNCASAKTKEPMKTILLYRPWTLIAFSQHVHLPESQNHHPYTF